ncbi:MAG: tetratricopeptide repeat protein [Candidatus Zixiibacteriota bacterium]|nr:MAG: tetratricopeptide repeat protein [candidate division Zixibacteria bacterium]
MLKAVISILALFVLVSTAAAQNARLDQAVALFDSGRYAEARAELEAIVKQQPKNARAYAYLGRIAFAERDTDRAVKWLKKAVDLEETSSQYYAWLGYAYGQDAQHGNPLGRLAAARKCKSSLEKAVNLDPQNHAARMGLMEYYLQAPSVAGGDKEKALAEAETLRRQDPLLGHRAFALIYEVEEQYDLARREYDQAIAAYPDSIDLRIQLGYFQQRREAWDQAFATFEQIWAEHPEEINACYQIGRTGALSGQNLDRSTECLRHYLQQQPGEDDPPLEAAHYRLGMVYQKAGKVDQARAEYQAVLRTDPKHEGAKEALKSLK